MAILLNIDTSTQYASVCISDDEKVLAFADSGAQKEHASFVHVAIKSLIEKAGIGLKEIDAVAIASGPGSYTGLRVGMATAKGICYALNKPLICVNTLEAMLEAALAGEAAPCAYLCPMIDARRMEVFTAIYKMEYDADNRNRANLIAPCAMVAEQDVFDKFLDKGTVLFFGDGAEKCTPLINHVNSRFARVQHSAVHVALIAQRLFKLKHFADVAYAEPAYFKEFYSAAKKT